jgi:surfactin family lipopeptide synthetase C
LPEYMVPGVYVGVEKLPLTANGKVDRKRLPEPEQSNLVHHAEGELPRNPIETAIAATIAEVLGVRSVTIRDDFFQLGGDSLLATRTVSRLRSMFAVDLPLRAIFDAPTTADLAQRILEIYASQFDNSQQADSLLESLERMSESEVVVALEDHNGTRTATTDITAGKL